MSTSTVNTDSQGVPGSLEPYAQLFRALAPRASNVAVFDAAGHVRWSGDATVGPDLLALIEAMLPGASAQNAADGELRQLGNTQPVYVCWLRDDDRRLLGAVALLQRGAGGDAEPRPFSFVQSLLKPALECLRREFMAGASLQLLRATVEDLDRDLTLLLSDAADADTGADGADELKMLMAKIVEHCRCQFATLIVPEKNIALVRAAAGTKPDKRAIARSHRYLRQRAAGSTAPVTIGQLDEVVPGTRPYHVVACPVRDTRGHGMGVLALFHAEAPRLSAERAVRVAQILARRAAGIIASRYDPLTGLLTRTAFEQRVRIMTAELTAAGDAWSALYINCDRMHVINDSNGMQVGDAVIGQVGELIRTRLPQGALAARISGDRFTVLLHAGLEEAGAFAESLRAGAQLLGPLHQQAKLDVSLSIGVAPLGNVHGGELSHALAAAEMACKAAKDRGRNRVASYEPADQSVIRRVADMALSDRVREAVFAKRLRLDAQLIAPLRPAPDSTPHYELLVRMLGMDGAVINPDSFLPAATRYQMLPSIDRWVLGRALELLQPHAGALRRRPFVTAINVSGQSLSDDGYIDYLFECVEHGGVDPRAFCFEITESSTILNLARAENVIRRLRRLGCEVALDDFGTGLCSLSYLRQLPVTMLKIDGSFVRDMVRDSRADSMVQVIARMAAIMGLKTVAEYVETAEIRARVAAHGVDYAQGYALARAEPFEPLLARLLAAATVESEAAPDESASSMTEKDLLSAACGS